MSELPADLSDPATWNWVELPLYDLGRLNVILRAAGQGEEIALTWLAERELLSLLGSPEGEAAPPEI